MIEYNPVTKAGKFQVTDKITKITKKITALDEVSAKWQMAEKLNIKPAIHRVNGQLDFETYKAEVKAMYERIKVVCISKTERMRDN